MSELPPNTASAGALTTAGKGPTSLEEVTEVEARHFAVRYLTLIEQSEIYSDKRAILILPAVVCILSLTDVVLPSWATIPVAVATGGLVLGWVRLLSRYRREQKKLLVGLGAGQVASELLKHFERIRFNASSSWSGQTKIEKVTLLSAGLVGQGSSMPSDPPT